MDEMTQEQWQALADGSDEHQGEQPAETQAQHEGENPSSDDQGEQPAETQALLEEVGEPGTAESQPRKRISRSNVRYEEFVSAGIRAPQDEDSLVAAGDDGEQVE